MPEHWRTSNSVQDLIEVYCKTHYDLRMTGGHRCTVRIGQPSPLPLQAFLSNMQSAFLITACNPCSLPLTVIVNRQRMRQLLEHAKTEKLVCLPGVGHVPGQVWRESFLLLAGSESHKIDSFARQFEQNAVVHLHANRPPRLRLYRADWLLDPPHTQHIDWVANVPV